MAASLNRVILIGNLTADPELKYTSSGTARTKFRIAINRQYKDSSGQLQEETAFVPIVAWRTQAENCAQYLSKGRSVAVEGRLRIYNFTDEEGREVRWFEIVAQNVQFLGGPPRSASEPGTVPPSSDQPTQGAKDEEEVPF
jgi:single-strand DNA-binding protein